MAEVVVMSRPSLNDIPAMLRRLAERVEADEFGPVQFVTAVLVGEKPEQTFEAFLWGKANELEMLGAFAIAHHRIMK